MFWKPVFTFSTTLCISLSLAISISSSLSLHFFLLLPPSSVSLSFLLFIQLYRAYSLLNHLAYCSKVIFFVCVLFYFPEYPCFSRVKYLSFKNKTKLKQLFLCEEFSDLSEESCLLPLLCYISEAFGYEYLVIPY